MAEYAIEANGLTRYFGNKPVVQQATFTVPVGSVTGLLGLNGAGKSTTIRMLMGLLEPTRGSCSLLGVDSRQLKPEDRVRVGYTIEGHYLYSGLTVRDAELVQADCFPRWNSLIFQSTISRFGISPTDRIRHLSRGQRAGVSIALTLSSQPELLVLDDPSLGLDPVARRALNETILEFIEPGDRSVLLSSHMLDDIERVADRVMIMVEGRIVVNTTVPDFLSRIVTWSCECAEDFDSISIPGLISKRRIGKRWLFTVVDGNEETEQVIQTIGGGEATRTESSFDEAVVAYLSRSRTSESFLQRG